MGSVTATFAADYGTSLPQGVRLIASDYSKGVIAYVGMLKEYSETESNDLWQNLETHILDAQDLSSVISPSSLSHVLSNLVLMAADDASKPIVAAYEALETGGVLAFTVLTSYEWITIWEHAKELLPNYN